MKLHRSFVACALLALAGAARAQAIDTVAPPNGAPGAVLTIDGNGFLNGGTAKPKVFLRDAATQKKTALQVTAFSDTQVTAVFSKGLPGDRDVVVLPKGGAEIVSATAFEVEMPAFAAVDSGLPQADHAAPGAEVTATGANFGTLKGSLKIGRKKAKVLTWADDAITFQMPPKLEDGFYSVSVRNGVGTHIVSFAIVVTGGSPKKHKPDKLTAKVDKSKFKTGLLTGLGLPWIFTSFESEPEPPAPDMPRVIISTSANIAQLTKTFDISVPFDPAVDAAQPYAPGDPNGYIAYREAPQTAPLEFTIWDSIADNECSIVVYSFAGGQLDGVFSGTLDYTSVIDPPNLVVTVTKGKFRGTLPP